MSILNEMTTGSHSSENSAPRGTQWTPDVLDNVRWGLYPNLQNNHFNFTTQHVWNFVFVRAIIRELVHLLTPEEGVLGTVGKHELL